MLKINSIKSLITDEEIFRDDRHLSVEILEIGKKSLVIEIPSINKSGLQKILIGGLAFFQGRELAFQFIGLVVNMVEFEGGTRLEVDLLQYDRQLWLSYLEQNFARQKRADEVFRLIKGGS